MAAIEDARAGEQHRPRDLGQGETQVCLDEAEPHEIRALGDRDPEAQLLQALAGQELVLSRHR